MRRPSSSWRFLSVPAWLRLPQKKRARSRRLRLEELDGRLLMAGDVVEATLSTVEVCEDVGGQSDPAVPAG
ncbi:MAG TPA: hypothetical protein P5307_28125, partial [Pirellulaceae bacterium]|nr:hypothetical protein [Pirellulaceae bacterium]